MSEFTPYLLPREQRELIIIELKRTRGGKKCTTHELSELLESRRAEFASRNELTCISVSLKEDSASRRPIENRRGVFMSFFGHLLSKSLI